MHMVSLTGSSSSWVFRHQATKNYATKRSFSSLVNVYSSLEQQNCIDYARGWAWQTCILEQRMSIRRLRKETCMDDKDTILILEHKPVYTLGRGANENHLTFLENQDTDKIRALSRKTRGRESARLSVDRSEMTTLLRSGWNDKDVVDKLSKIASPVIAPNSAPIYRVERGGEVTYHGPGQLVVYPMFDLTREPFRQDLHWFLRTMEEVVVKTLAEYEIVGTRDTVNTGVWVGNQKVCAMGFSASRWVTTHGFALNVSPDLGYFDTSVIIPCGLDGRGVTSISKLLVGRGDHISPTVEDVADVVLQKLQEVLAIKTGDRLLIQ